MEERATHVVACARSLRTQAAQHGWSVVRLVEQIHQHCGHSRLRAQRLARGWTLGALADRISQTMPGGRNVTPSRACRWELGQDSPSLAYRDALCRVYDADLEGLGLARTGRSGSDLDTRSGGRAVRPESAYAPGAYKLSIVQSAADLRQKMDDTLTGSILSESTVEHKEKVAEQYGRVYKIQSTEYFLSNILADFNEVRSLTDRRLPSGQRHDLCGVIARMAGLVSMAMVNIGQYREAREWVHTARLAADESAEPSLRAWVATRAAVAHLHFGDPAAALVAAREAEMLTRSNPV